MEWSPRITLNQVGLGIAWLAVCASVALGQSDPGGAAHVPSASNRLQWKTQSPVAAGPTTQEQRVPSTNDPSQSEPAAVVGLAPGTAVPPLGSLVPATPPGLTEPTPAPREFSVPLPEVPLPEVPTTLEPVAAPLPAPTHMLTQPWWVDENAVPLDEATPTEAWELEQLIWLAVKNSPYVQAQLAEPQILQAEADAALGQFDPNTFVESIFHDTSDPVGNVLTTGSASRLNDHMWNNSSGIRAKNSRGGLAELAQDFNFKDSNSDFFVPGNQADSRMVMRYTQPLMRGAGVAYNRSSYIVASLAANQSLQQASKQIQDHAFAITSTYWELYAARAFHRQIERGLLSLQQLRNQLAGRADIDGLKSQLLRADAAISRQVASRAKAVAQIRAAEANLRAAVAAPLLRDNWSTELVPATPTADWPSQVFPENELALALNYHPEIRSIRENLQATRVKLQVAENELRPTLNLVLESYVRGLNGGFNAVQSFGDQFSEGAPSYSAGMAYARPYNNTAARAILRERRLEMRRTLLELDQALLTVQADVATAIAQLTAAYSELESAVRATLATHAEIEYLTARWRNAFLDGAGISLLLDQMLNAEIQLTQAENAWARAQADHMIALANLRRATGSLLPMLE